MKKTIIIIVLSLIFINSNKPQMEYLGLIKGGKRDINRTDSPLYNPTIRLSEAVNYLRDFKQKFPNPRNPLTMKTLDNIIEAYESTAKRYQNENIALEISSDYLAGVIEALMILDHNS